MREQLWIAMSDLWLDTELSDARLEEIPAVIRRSGLTRDELEIVFTYEFAPFLGANPWRVGGEWRGFDPDWVREQARVCRAKWRKLAGFATTLGLSPYAARPTWEGVETLAFTGEAS